MPLPFRLDHVNVWLLREGDGWSAVDCGVDNAATRSAWEALLEGPLEGLPVRRLVATHGHVDHVGGSGWLIGRMGASFTATLAAWLWARVGHAQVGKPAPPESLRHLEAHGADPEHVAAFAKDRGPVTRLFGEQPVALERLHSGDRLEMGGRAWQVHTADGHADEHATFYCGDDAILIAGDQILQRISPVVGVFASEPEADPLSAYLASLDHYVRLPDRALVLPSHGLPFYGLRTRIAQLRQHHASRLELTLAALDQPRTATECAERLFERAMREGQWFLALAETLSHLHYLMGRGEVAREKDSSGLIRFFRA
jgi:glyoxylase-like metal-dependent hydrolase (beta-lactamase superfamily II)